MVGGVKYHYKYYNITALGTVEGFIADNFTSATKPGVSTTTTTGTRVMVNSAGGINLRDGSCNKFGTVPNGSMATLKQKVGYCYVNGVQYNMIYVQFDNGTRANVAESLVKYM
jgi:hypothetical protein